MPTWLMPCHGGAGSVPCGEGLQGNSRFQAASEVASGVSVGSELEAVPCHLCKMWLNGAQQYLDHTRGKRHRKNLKAQREPGRAGTCLPASEEARGAQEVPVPVPTAKLELPTEPATSAFCPACSVSSPAPVEEGPSLGSPRRVRGDQPSGGPRAK